jgi:chromosome segregation ATPase
MVASFFINATLTTINTHVHGFTTTSLPIRGVYTSSSRSSQSSASPKTMTNKISAKSTSSDDITPSLSWSISSPKLSLLRRASHLYDLTHKGKDNEEEEEYQHLEWTMLLQSQEIQQVRRELIEKSISSLGKTRTEAEAEVDRFLEDREQSQPYLEMRRSAQSQELVGPEFFVQLAGSFAVGWLTMAFANHGVDVSF